MPKDIINILLNQAFGISCEDDPENACDPEPSYCRDAHDHLIFTEGDERLHAHKCPKCETTWTHPRPPIDVDRDVQHTCPNPDCSGGSRWKQDIRKLAKIDYPWNGNWR